MEEVRIQISGAQGRTARYEAAVRRAGGQPANKYIKYTGGVI